jgi:hypothetical protein
VLQEEQKVAVMADVHHTKAVAPDECDESHTLSVALGGSHTRAVAFVEGHTLAVVLESHTLSAMDEMCQSQDVESDERYVLIVAVEEYHIQAFGIQRTSSQLAFEVQHSHDEMVEENHSLIGLVEVHSYPASDYMQIQVAPEVNSEGDTLALAEEASTLAFLQKLAQSLPGDQRS